MSATGPDIDGNAWAPRLGEPMDFCELAPLTRAASLTVVVLHHTVSKPETTAAQVDAWHRQRSWRCIGYHFLIRHGSEGWEVVYGRSIDHAAAAAVGWNSTGIHIAMAGDYSREDPPAEALAALGWLLNWITFVVPRALPLVGHRELSGQETACPGQAIEAARRLPEALGLPVWRRS